MKTSYRKLSHRVVLLFTLAIAGLSAGDAFAEHRQRNIDVAFDELDARVVHGKLQVTYEIDHRDWRELQRLHIRPRLNLYTPTRRGRGYEFATSVPVEHRTATVYFPHRVTPRRAGQIELRLSGERGRARIATTSYGRDCATRVRIAVHRPRHPGHGPRHDVALINACGANTTWSGDLEQCIERGARISRGAPATINACGAATSWSGDFLGCLDLAAAQHHAAAQTIHACSAATTWSGDFKACMQTAAAYRGPAAPTITACKAATTWSGDFKECLSDAAALGPRAPGIVHACDSATSWSGDFKQCLVAARRS